ncbi:hypothetical protein [Pseudaminobacter sp. NGMCC 1.201702]|uniref:hypothetical protein n=1 Tax=Pseudaminobacter sp. NGMCC 1.201702 TaxID=3391825 RepID=UPI0039F06300
MLRESLHLLFRSTFSLQSRGAKVFFLLLPSAVALALAGSPPARAHQAPSGWAYPLNCCSNQDCREVAHKAISERPEGYVIIGTGEVLSYKDGRVKDSPDGEYHWCSADGADDGRTICLFVPPRSF